MIHRGLKVALLICLIFVSCKKENGRHKYIFQLNYDNGTTNLFVCEIYEKYKKNKKYNEKFSNKFNAKVNDGKAIYLTYGGYIFLKINNKLICADQIYSYNYIQDVYFETALFKLYPNPSSTTATIELIKDDVRSFQYEVMDMSGKLIESGVVAGKTKQLSLPPGMYLVNVKTKESWESKKLVMY